jgi:hypothetical protein
MSLFQTRQSILDQLDAEEANGQKQASAAAFVPDDDPTPQTDGIETISVSGNRLPPLTAQDRELLARMIFAEGAQDYRMPGLFQALGSTALNRQGLPEYDTSIADILRAARQFQGIGHLSPDPAQPPLWEQSANPDRLTGPNRAAFAAARSVADDLAAGVLSDNTGGATRFGSRARGDEMPRPMQALVDTNRYERSRNDIGN